jgi:hypothetical protein
MRNHHLSAILILRGPKGGQPCRRFLLDGQSLADNYPPLAHNQSMNKVQSRVSFLTPDP